MCMVLKILLTCICPPLAVLLEKGCGCDFCCNLFLSLLCFLPGCIHACCIVCDHKKEQQSQLTTVTSGNPGQNQINRGYVWSGAQIDEQYVVAMEPSRHANNMLVQGSNIGATANNNPGGASNMLVYEQNIEVEKTKMVTSNDKPHGATERNVDIGNLGGGSGGNNCVSANNTIIEGENITLGNGKGSSGNNTSSANNIVIKGNNINLQGDGDGSSRNNSSEANNLMIKGSNVNYEREVTSQKNGASVVPCVVIPSVIDGIFRFKAKSNSDQQLETSAILLGKQYENELTITNLLFLPQITNDIRDKDIRAKLLEKQSDLIVLGWMSTNSPIDSINFHRYSKIHSFIKEAIAILVSRDNEIGFDIYKISTLKFIIDCRENKIPIENKKELLNKYPPLVKYKNLKFRLMDLD